MTSVKAFSRRTLYETGLLGLWHRWHNAKALTVAMFHRVLPRGDRRWSAAEADYTIEADLFAECLRFFKRHYCPIRLADLRESDGALEALPPRPLLITFDDGWADNLDTALPILEREKCPALVFVAAGVLGDQQPVWWHDLVAFAYGTGAIAAPELAPLRAHIDRHKTSASGPLGEQQYAALLALHGLAASQRDELLAPVARMAHFAPPRQMLDEAGLQVLARSPWIEIGAHGFSHLPLTGVSQPFHELEQAKARLTVLLGEGAGQRPVDSLSFPHGQWSQALVDAACGLGYRFLFTSEAKLERRRRLAGLALGRVYISTRQLVDDAGGFAPDRLAGWLFLRQGTGLA